MRETEDLDNCCSALFMAGRRGHLETVHVLLDHGADINVECGSLGCPLFQYLVIMMTGKRRPWEMFKLLIEHGADLDHKNEQKRTSVFYAARDEDIRMLELLLDDGAGIERPPLLYTWQSNWGITR